MANDDHAEQEAKSMAQGLRKSPLSEQWDAIEVVDEGGHKIYKVPVNKRDRDQD